MRISWPAEGDAILFEHRFQHLQARAERELEQLSARIDEQIDQRQVAGSFNSGGTWDCARLFHGGSCSVRLSPRVWLPLVYHEQRRSRRFNFQQLLGHPRNAAEILNEPITSSFSNRPSEPSRQERECHSRLNLAPFPVTIALIRSTNVAAVLRKMTRPGTVRVISVPEPAALTTVSVAPMRAARSRKPCKPKCPSFPSSTIVGSMPTPLSATRTVRS